MVQEEEFVFNEAIQYFNEESYRESRHRPVPEGPLITEEEE